MGGEGSMMSANQSLKNNRSLSKRKENKALAGSYANIELKTFPKATPQQLQEIKERTQLENKQHQLKIIVLFIIACISLWLAIKYLL
jgi:hypothetical protein